MIAVEVIVFLTKLCDVELIIRIRAAFSASFQSWLFRIVILSIHEVLLKFHLEVTRYQFAKTFDATSTVGAGCFGSFCIFVGFQTEYETFWNHIGTEK